MRKFLTKLFAAVLLLGAFVLPAAAQPPFSEDELIRCLADFPAFVEHMEAQDEALEGVEDPSLLQALAANHAAGAWLNGKGWDPERFGYVLDHVGKGYVALKMRAEPPSIDTTGMTPEMAAMVQAQMAQAMSQMAAARRAEGVPESEMALIEAHGDEITEMFESLE